MKIDKGEATTIMQLYELYQAHGSVGDVTEHADQLGLRSRRRERPGGRVSGGTPLDRGHIHHILSNPIYAGRIRHKVEVHEGQHPAIIDPAVWEDVQQKLLDSSAVPRGRKRKTSQSQLAGKIFDETGDRLTPSHSQKAGKRSRYYISRRLVTDRSHKHPDAWRLPAEQLERLLSDQVRQHLARPDAAASMTANLSAAEIASVAVRLASLDTDHLALIDRVDLRPGSLSLHLDPSALAKSLGCPPDQINPAALTIDAPFRTRRRGVEVKLHLGEASPELDRTLIANIVKARRWLALVIDGKTFAEIAQAEGTSKRRIQDLVDLAFLAPEVLDAVASGEQPTGLTTDRLIKTGFPAIWSEQRKAFAAL